MKAIENAGQAMKKGRDIFASTLLKLGFPEVLRYFFISFLCKKREGCIKGKKNELKGKRNNIQSYQWLLTLKFVSVSIQVEFRLSFKSQ